MKLIIVLVALFLVACGPSSVLKEREGDVQAGSTDAPASESPASPSNGR